MSRKRRGIILLIPIRKGYLYTCLLFIIITEMIGLLTNFAIVKQQEKVLTSSITWSVWNSSVTSEKKTGEMPACAVIAI